jgi:hypothetical protein
MAIRYLLADGEAGELTQAEIARVAQVSQNTVNAAVNSWLSAEGEPLEGAPVTVELVARRDVRGYRWRMTPRPPAEVAANGGAWHGRSETDQRAPAAAPPVAAPSAADRARSVTDQHGVMDQHGGGGETPTALLAPDQVILFNALLSEGIHSKQHAMEAVKNMPGATLADFRAQVAYAADRGKHAPMAFVLALWARGQAYRRPAPQPETITTARQSAARGGARNAARRPARYAADDAAQREARGISPSVSNGPPPGLKLATWDDWYTGKTLDGI